MFQNLYSPASPAHHPQPCLLLLRKSNECRDPSHHTKTTHDLYSPALPGARGGVQVFSTFRPQMFQNLYSPASPAQHPQPGLLLLRRSNECSGSFPPYKNSTCSMHSPALPGARGGVQVFSTFRPQMFQKLYSPASPALRRSNECRVPSRHTKTAHVLCIPLHCLGRARGSTGFQHFQAPNVPKPVRPRVPGPALPTLLIASPKK